MGWLLELLFEAVREFCSQFIVDMMDIASGMFTEILSCDLDLFEELFGVAGDLYREAVLPLAVMILLMILVWQLFKSMFGKAGVSSEDPIELVLRSGICLFMIFFAKDIVNYVLEIAGTPYQWITGTDITVSSFSEYVSALEAFTNILGGDLISIQLLMLIMHIVVAWNYFKMLFILAERYVLLGVFAYTSPLAFSTGGAKATNNILASWSKMFGGQVLVVILDAWCVKMFLSAYGNLAASSYGFTKFFAATMCLIGFCKIVAKLDSYMSSFGVNLGRISSGLSGMGALLMAGRIMQMGGRSFGGGKGNASPMNIGGGGPIPLGGAPGMKEPGMGAFGTGSGPVISGMDTRGNPQSFGNGGMAAGMDDRIVKENSSDRTQEETENAFNTSGNEKPGLDSRDFPFGMPDAEGYDMNELETPLSMSKDSVLQNGAEGMETYAAGEAGINSLADADRSQYSIPGEDSSEELLSGFDVSDNRPFGSPYENQTTDLNGIVEYDDYPLYGEEGTDLSGYSGGYDKENIAESRFGVLETGTGNVQLSGYDDIPANVTGISENIAGTEQAFSGQETPEFIDHITGNAAYGTMEYPSPETDALYLGTTYGTETGFAGKENTGIPGDTKNSISGIGFAPVGNGIFRTERDGQNYLCFDTALYGRPHDPYRTVRENGKSYYEIPEGRRYPSAFLETKAVLGKDGTIRLERAAKDQPVHSSGTARPAVERKTKRTAPLKDGASPKVSARSRKQQT